MYLAHVFRASALLRADLDELLQHSLVTAIRIFSEPPTSRSARDSCNNKTPFKDFQVSNYRECAATLMGSRA